MRLAAELLRTFWARQFIIKTIPTEIMRKTLLVIPIAMLRISGIGVGQSHAPGKKFDNQYLTMTILPGWAAEPSADQKLSFIHGKYLLTINPIFTHATSAARFEQVAVGPSVEAVTSKLDDPSDSYKCALWPPEKMIVNNSMSLGNLYTTASKSESGCTFPTSGQSVWFGSYVNGEGPESEYTITLMYDTTDVNRLPGKNSPELRHIFRDVVAMLKTLDLKPPIFITKVDPQSAAPSTTVTIYGSGFSVPNFNIAVSFSDFPNNFMPAPIIAADGKSLTFKVPTSINTISCKAGSVDVKGWCIAAPADHINVNDCPQRSDGATNFCGVPMPPATYEISVSAEGSGVYSNPVLFTVAEPKPSPVSILLIYPNYLVSAGDAITVRGSGFTSTGNTVKIGSAVVNDLSSADGRTITFQAPASSGDSFIRGIRIYRAFVSDANGESNSINFGYR
jgi:hypothetical protein